MKNFDLIVAGYGGQGILTLAEIISEAAAKQGYDVKEAELHGLAQRGGSLECHIRLGKKVFSPLVTRGKADLIIALDAFDALCACYWANKNTIVLVNSKLFRLTNIKRILEKVKKFTKKIHIVDADEEVRKITGNITSVNIFMLGYAIKKGFLPLKKEITWLSIKKKIRKIFLEENKKVFERAFEYL